jgi:hypothetical protein
MRESVCVWERERESVCVWVCLCVKSTFAFFFWLTFVRKYRALLPKYRALLQRQPYIIGLYARPLKYKSLLRECRAIQGFLQRYGVEDIWLFCGNIWRIEINVIELYARSHLLQSDCNKRLSLVCVAVCCSVLQCVVVCSVCCSVLQCVCSVWHWVVVCCIVLQRVYVGDRKEKKREGSKYQCVVLCVAVRCSV